jgi:cytochrome P450
VSITESGAGGCPVIPWEFADGPLEPLTGFGRMDAFGPSQALVRVEEAQGYYMATDHATITEILQDPERFSSTAIIPLEPDPAYQWIPEMLDPPEHTAWRRLLAPHFTPKRAEDMSDAVRARCAEIIDGFAGKGEIDFVDGFARRFPTSIFLELFGLPAQDLDGLLDWEFQIMHPDNEADPDRTRFLAAMNSVMGYFGELIATRRANPDDAREDLLSIALGWRIDGEPIPDEQMLPFCLFLFIAGLDTVTSQLTYMFHHLATNVGDRDRIAAEPRIRAKAVEEFLRAHGIIVSGRKVTVDTVVNGCPIKAGEMIALRLSGAGRDASIYPDAHRIDLDRDFTRHISFGSGRHTCLGAHLARQEMRIALDEWHKRIPAYSIAPHAVILERTAGTWGLDSLPLIWLP